MIPYLRSLAERTECDCPMVAYCSGDNAVDPDMENMAKVTQASLMEILFRRAYNDFIDNQTLACNPVMRAK